MNISLSELRKDYAPVEGAPRWTRRSEHDVILALVEAVEAASVVSAAVPHTRDYEEAWERLFAALDHFDFGELK